MAHDGAQFPSGYRFCPVDHQLINDYLKNKVMNLPLPCDIIKDVVNLYDHNPRDLKEKFKISDNEKEWYFFTSRYDKYENGDPSNNRASRCGYWKRTGTQKPITYKGNVIGYKKSLVFYKNKPPQGIKTHWIIHEYMLHKITTSPGGVIKGRKRQKKTNVADDNKVVLCRIYEKLPKDVSNDEDQVPAESVGSNNTQHYNDCNGMTLIEQHQALESGENSTSNTCNAIQDDSVRGLDIQHY